MPNIKKTKAKKHIGRKIQTRPFESVSISIECEDEIEWETIDERNQKLRELTDRAIEDFKETFGQVCEVLGFEEKRAFINKSNDEDVKKNNKEDVDLINF